jgi:hypothetical protein
VLNLEIDSNSTRMPLSLLQLWLDLTLLERSVNDSRSRTWSDVEQLTFKIAAFGQPTPYAPEWYALYEYTVRLLERVVQGQMAGTIRVSDAFCRVAQFVLENEDLVLESVVH